MAPVKFNLQQISAALQTQWGDNTQGVTKTWIGPSITYAIPTQSPPGSQPNGNEPAGFDIMDVTQDRFARLAFELWDDLIAIDLNELTGPNSDSTAQITIARSSTTLASGTYCSTTLIPLPSGGSQFEREIGASRVWLNTGWAEHANGTYVLGERGLENMIHEIGHALGLSHPGPYDASNAVGPTYANSALYTKDTLQYSIMSYFPVGSDGATVDRTGTPGASDVNRDGANIATPLLHDIMAIQHKYGADMTTRTGNTVYGFNSTANRSVFDFNLNRDPVIAIWDAGGRDTLDVSGFGQTQNVDLRAGFFSDIGALSKNVVIAYNCLIENAVGGSGIDTIIGNQANNRLVGNAGRDVLLGSTGNDVLRGGLGADSLLGGTENDTLYGDEDGAAGSADTLNGGAGNDTMYGAAGFDTYLVDSRRDVASEAVVIRVGGVPLTVDAGGRDVVRTTVSYTLEENPSSIVEDLTFIGTGMSTLLGNSANNEITGGSATDLARGQAGEDTLNGNAGNDLLVGGADRDWLFGDAGNDTLRGGEGADLLFGGAHDDTASYNAATSGIVVDMRLGVEAGTSGEAEGDRYRSIEHVDGSNFDDSIHGDTGANRLRGLDGKDTIWGATGNDTLNGGEGDDLLFATNGDVVNGGGGFDILDADVNTAATGFFFNAAGTLIEYVNGGDGNDSLDATGVTTGVSFVGQNGNDTLTGGSGDDGLSGSDGDDLMNGGLGFDILNGDQGNDTLQGGGGPTNNPPFGDHLYGGQGDDLVIGSGFGFVFGNAGNDTLTGGTEDRIGGGAGDDSITGGNGINYLEFLDSWGSDTVTNFEDGTDILWMFLITDLNDFSQLAIANMAGGVEISFAGNTLLLQGITAAQLTIADFNL